VKKVKEDTEIEINDDEIIETYDIKNMDWNRIN
jgi:hypothetical protein